MNTPFPAGSVNEAVYLSLRNFPSLYSNRTQVLAAMFISYGTGYYWHEGRLVDLYEATDRERSEDDVIQAYPEELSKGREGESEFWAEYRRKERADWDARNEAILAIRRNAEALATTPGPLTHIVEPNELGPYAHVPADVKPDWAAACDEIVAAAEQAWAEDLHNTHRHRSSIAVPELSPEVAKVLADIWNNVVDKKD